MSDVNWTYNETPTFVKCAEDLNLSEEVREGLRLWAVSVRRVSTRKNTRLFLSPNNVFEIWKARIPDPDSNRGASGGFRLIYFMHLQNGAIYLDRIERRGNLGRKSERRRSQQKFTNYVKELKKYLMENLEEK